ncbi:hypothetical protein [Paraburkholderia terrae]|uniref:hypothetical protein n=1 Tax=Paraburkholderia terrae TaxID=311230 RepID=UPI001EE2A8FE|nr:hypothetical protein [Paraburkholderia terrae]GJH02282.1 hypothetical protein CBA19C8_17015 [Paraburkholderia terrae]
MKIGNFVQAPINDGDCNQLQSTAGAMFAAAESTSTSSVVRKRATPRKIPGLAKSEQRGFIVSDRALVGGNWLACAMLGDLRYWLEPDESGKVRATREAEGHRWVARSRQHWMRLFDATEQEVKTALRHLHACTGIKHQTMEFGNWNTEHYRLDFEQIGHKYRADQKGVSSNPTPVSSNLATSGSTHEVQKDKNPKTKTAPQESAQGKATPTPNPAPLCVPAGQSPEPSPAGNVLSFPASPAGKYGEEISDALADAVIKQKQIWNQMNQKEVVTASLNPDERRTVWMLSERLEKIGIDPLDYVRVWTPENYQAMTFALDSFAHFNVFHLAKTKVFNFCTEAYRRWLANGRTGMKSIIKIMEQELAAHEQDGTATPLVAAG